METQVMRILVSPEVLQTVISDVTVSGQTYGVYSAMTQGFNGWYKRHIFINRFNGPNLTRSKYD